MKNDMLTNLTWWRYVFYNKNLQVSNQDIEKFKEFYKEVIKAGA
jgi:hypothetical protein